MWLRETSLGTGSLSKNKTARVDLSKESISGVKFHQYFFKCPILSCTCVIRKRERKRAGEKVHQCLQWQNTWMFWDWHKPTQGCFCFLFLNVVSLVPSLCGLVFFFFFFFIRTQSDSQNFWGLLFWQDLVTGPSLACFCSITSGIWRCGSYLLVTSSIW